MPTKRKATKSAAEGPINKRRRVAESRPRQTRSRAARPGASPLIMLDDRGRPIVVHEPQRAPEPQAVKAAESPIDDAGSSTPAEEIEDCVIVAHGPVRAARRTAEVPHETVLDSIEEPPAEYRNGSPSLSFTDVPAHSDSPLSDGVHERKRRRSTISGSDESHDSNLPPSAKRFKRSTSEHTDGREASLSPSVSFDRNGYSEEDHEIELDYDDPLDYGTPGLPTVYRSNTPSPEPVTQPGNRGADEEERDIELDYDEPLDYGDDHTAPSAQQRMPSPSRTVIPGLSTIYPSERIEPSREPVSEPVIKVEDEIDWVESDSDSVPQQTVKVEGEGHSSIKSDTESAPEPVIRPEDGESGPRFDSSSESASEPAIKVEDSEEERERLEREEEAVRFYHDNSTPVMKPGEENEEEVVSSEAIDSEQDSGAPESVIRWMEGELGVGLDGLRANPIKVEEDNDESDSTAAPEPTVKVEDEINSSQRDYEPEPVIKVEDEAEEGDGQVHEQEQKDEPEDESGSASAPEPEFMVEKEEGEDPEQCLMRRLDEMNGNKP
ncbi:hypothetical protein C8A03DRAFT_36555 [Achaetomium macrosporum]|uniref:Uncharacterized protein n=1 Tax=Achaetomium macrosporum TaxID=79813 RepID=A0AAN7C6D2_9PEZI|nr:hypothetical protein C8A03DRAFT_36555 [Achaetomium macrosporum]